MNVKRKVELRMIKRGKQTGSVSIFPFSYCDSMRRRGSGGRLLVRQCCKYKDCISYGARRKELNLNVSALRSSSVYGSEISAALAQSARQGCISFLKKPKLNSSLNVGFKVRVFSLLFSRSVLIITNSVTSLRTVTGLTAVYGPRTPLLVS